MVGGQAIFEDLGIKLENVQLSDLGQAKKVVVDKDNTAPSSKVAANCKRHQGPYRSDSSGTGKLEQATTTARNWKSGSQSCPVASLRSTSEPRQKAK